MYETNTCTYMKLVSESVDVVILEHGTVEPRRMHQRAIPERYPGELWGKRNGLQWLRRPFVVAFLIVVSLLIPGIALGDTFWEDDFETDLMPNWDTSACGDSVPQDGCNPAIATEQAHSGAQSLRGDYISN